MKTPIEVVAERIKSLQEKEGEVGNQSIQWFPKKWKDLRFLAPDVNDLTILCGGDRHESKISRRQVIEFGDSPLRLFLSSMVFGYGDRGYGWWRVENVLKQLPLGEFESRLERQFKAAATSPEASWLSHTRYDRARVRYLGPAFATKFAYFAALKQEKTQGIPLIADANTSKAIDKLFGVQNSTRFVEQYVRYVDKVGEVAGLIGQLTASDEVERALFDIGKSL